MSAGDAADEADETDETDEESDEEAPASERGDAPSSEAPPREPAAANSQTLEIAAGVCSRCKKENHAAAPACVFCGAALEPRATRPSEGAAAKSVASLLGADPSLLNSISISRSRAERVSEDEIQVPVADPLIGVVVADRYRILGGIGRGGMGIVYRVEHTKLGKFLAMKLLTGELSRNSDVVRRFKQEAMTASKLSNPNTVQVFDYGVSEGLTYLVMELVDGLDLGRSLKERGPLPFSTLGPVVVQICNSLQEAHAHGIVHRDIKPENVMVTRAKDGTTVAKVLDFGLAKLREGAELNDVTSQGAIVGTPYFMSPEQVKGENVDSRSDIYSLGALMYRALTGHYPFSGPNPMSVFTKHLTEAPSPPSRRAPDRGIPPGVDAIVLRAMEKDPAARFQRVEELQAAVVEELRAEGSASQIDGLLDSANMRRLARERPSGGAAGPILTRDEIEQYERKLRRQGLVSLAVGALVLAVITAVTLRFVVFRPRPFSGEEKEPNDTAAEATPVPFGLDVSGHVGRRPEPQRGDRDTFAYVLPERGTVNLFLQALPNFPICATVSGPGTSGQYCTGRAARDLEVPALRLEAGRYVVTVAQDLDAYGRAPPPLHENVSDAYLLRLRPADPPEGEEVEPNDQIASATPLAPNKKVRGRLAWARDEDVVCAEAGTDGLVLRVTDEPRDVGAVLEATPLEDGLEGTIARIHTAPAPARVHADPSLGDLVGAWESAPLRADRQTCVRLRAARDPWAEDASVALVPPGSPALYTVELVEPKAKPAPPKQPPPKPPKPKGSARP